MKRHAMWAAVLASMLLPLGTQAAIVLAGIFALLLAAATDLRPVIADLGDILALRAQTRGCVGVITDGCVRDYSLVANQGMPVWAAGPHPAVLGRRHIPWDIDVDIQCGGALVRPGDVIVADDDGPLVIPPHLVEELVGEAEQQEDEEVFIAQMVAAGESVDGLYPLGTAWRERYEQWVADGRPSTTTK